MAAASIQEALSPLTQQDHLKRFLYITDFLGVYVTGDPEPYLKHSFLEPFEPIFEWVNTSPDDFIQLLINVNDDNLLTRRQMIFYVLALALNKETLNPENRLKIRNSVLKIVKCDEDFFNFVKYYTLQRDKKQKISKSFQKLIIQFYNNKKPSELVKSVTQQDSYHGWSHKDLIKLVHYKSQDVGNIIFQI